MTIAATPPRLLVVDDEPDLRTLYELTLVREGYDVESAGSVEEGWTLLQQRGLFRASYAGETLREHYGLAWPQSAFGEARVLLDEAWAQHPGDRRLRRGTVRLTDVEGKLVREIMA